MRIRGRKPCRACGRPSLGEYCMACEAKKSPTWTPGHPMNESAEDRYDHDSGPNDTYRGQHDGRE